MRRIYLIRHGKPDIPPGERLCLGTKDLPLGVVGHLQACLLAQSSKNTPLSTVFCSQLIRSQETAQYLTDHPVMLPGLEEQYFGVWDGLSFREIKQRWPLLYEARGKDKSLLPEQAEPASAAQERFCKAVKQALAQSEGDIAIVTHRSVSQLFIASLVTEPTKPTEPTEPTQPNGYELPYASVTQLEWQEPSASEPHITITEIGAQHLPELSAQVCHSLLDAAGVPQNVKLHCEAVAREAERICNELQAAGHSLNKQHILSAALLHDIARLEKHHAQVGATWLREIGYPEIAAIVGQHHDLDDSTVLDEAAVVSMADRCVQEYKAVTLEQRFAKSAKKCTDEASQQAFQKRYQETIFLRDKINQICGKELIK